jgi:AcrR family transcriptional regulator
MSPRPRRREQNSNLQEAIKETAWKQIAENGASALSLRAIARELKITAPAIYNYFPDRDALVTALIVDAFTSLGETQRDTLQDLPPDDLPARLFTLGLAYREWAVTYPQRYQLIFGTPLPGYVAPEEVTLPAAQSSIVPLTETVQGLVMTGQFKVERTAPLTPALRSMLEGWSEAAGGTHIEALYYALVIWSRVHGLVSMEISSQLPRFITDPGEVFRREIATLLKQYLED